MLIKWTLLHDEKNMIKQKCLRYTEAVSNG